MSCKMMPGQFITMDRLSCSESPSKLQNLCRMCAAACNKPVPIFGPDGLINELAVKFCSYLPVKVSESDTLPLQLCYECTNLLIQWDAAVLVAIAADKKLRALQWREQQSHQSIHEVDDEISHPPEPLKRREVPAIRESLSCSVCNKSGMDFRELVEHLKSHDMPAPVSEQHDDGTVELNSSKSKSQTNAGSFSSIEENTSSELEENVLEPVVCLETPEPQRQLRSKKRNRSKSKDTEISPKVNEATGIKKRLRGKRSKELGRKENGPSLSGPEGDAGDPVVTSSTSGSSVPRPSENSESDDTLGSPSSGQLKPRRDSSDQLTFKPKVRIISAESINQTLEERFKANQMARNTGSQSPHVVFTPPSGLGQAASTSTLRPSGTTAALQQTRIILPRGFVKNMTNNSPSKPKFLKLADGRIIRLLGNITNGDGKGTKAVYATTSVHKSLPQSVLNHLAFKNVQQEKQLPNQSASKVSNSIEQQEKQSPTPLSSENVSNPSEQQQQDNPSLPTPLKQNVMISKSRIITFNLQPGPKNCANRFTCMFCGKRNLLQEMLHEHAQQHSPKKTEAGPSQDKSDTEREDSAQKTPWTSDLLF